MNMHSLVNARQSIGYMEKSGANLSQSLKRLSSGIKVDATDAGGLAVSTKMDSVITRTRTLGANVQNGMSFLESQDAAQSKLGAILTRMSELRVRFDDPTINTSDGANLNREFKELQDDVRALAQKKFNGISLFSSGSDADSKLVIGANSNNPSNVREVTRNQFFNSLLQTQSAGGPVGGSGTTQAMFGSFGGMNVTSARGTASVPGGKINGLQGSAITSIFTPVGGTASVPGGKVNGLQGTTPDFTLSGTLGTGTGATAPVLATGGGGGTPTAVWTSNLTGGTNSFDKMSPVFDSNSGIFIGLNEGNAIVRLDPTTGVTLNTYSMPGGRNESWKVALGDTTGNNITDTVYAAYEEAATGTGKLRAFNLDQTLKWEKTLQNTKTESPPFVDSNGNVYITANAEGNPFFGGRTNGKIYIFDSNGNELPAFPGGIDLDGEFTGGFAQSTDGTVYLTGSGRGNFVEPNRVLAAIDPTAANPLAAITWQKEATQFGGIDGRSFGAPVVLSGAGTPDDHFVVMNTMRNTADTRSRVRFYDQDGNFVDQYNWGANNNSFVSKGSPTTGVSGGVNVVFATSSNGVAALSTNGTSVTEQWKYTATGAEDFSNCTPAYDSTNNLVWVTDGSNGDVIGIRNAAEGSDAAGTVKHRIAAGLPSPGGGAATGPNAGSKSSPAIDSSGNVYVGYNNGDFTRISASGSPITLTDVNVGTGYTSAPSGPPFSPADIELKETTGIGLGTLAINSVTVDDGTLGGAAGSLRVTFTGAAAAAGGNYEVSAAGSTITPPAAVINGSNYLTTESAPTARVLAKSIASLGGTGMVAPPAGIDLSTGLVVLIDGDTDPAGGPISNPGSGPDATFAGGEAPTHETTDRRSGAGALNFDGTNDKINLGTLNTQIGNSAPGSKNTLTISSWIYRDTSGDQRIVCKSPSTTTGDHKFSLGINNDKLRMRIGVDGNNAVQHDGNAILPLNEWTHVAMTYDGTNLKSYVNGTLDTTDSLTGTTINSSPHDVYIGNSHNTNGRNFDGKLDDVGIWNVALDANHIAELAGPGNLTVSTSINDGTDPDPLKVSGSLTITPNSTSTLATSGPFTVEVDNGTVRAPGPLTGIGSGYTHGDTAPAVTLTDPSGALIPGFTATATINNGTSGGPPPPAAGTLNITYAGNPPDTNDVTVQIADGVGRLPNFSVPTSGFALGETPAVTILDNAGTLVPVAPGVINTSVDGTGTLNGDLSGVRTNDLGNHTVQIAAGTVRAPDPLTGIGSGYTFGDPAPAVALTDASGALIPGFTATATINNGTSGGPPPPAAGTLNIAFVGSPPNKNDVTIQIDDGVIHVNTPTGPLGSGYVGSDNPAFLVSGGGTSMGGLATPNGSGGLTVDLSGVRPSDFSQRTLQIAPGTTLQTPPPVNGIGAFHDPSGPVPTVTITGADVGGVTVNAVTVNPTGTVNVSFAGTPSGTGSLTVTVAGAGGTGSTGVSSKYLLDIDGDLWDYSVSEFGSFTKLVSDARAQNGAEQNSLSTFWELLSTNVNKLEQAAGRIKDADFAKEMTEVSKSQINSRSAAVMLGKQNRITSEALLTLQNLSNML